MGTAPLEASAILSEKKYAPPFIRTATTSAIVNPCEPPSIWPTKSSSSVNAVSRNVVLRVFINVGLPSAAHGRSGSACFRPLFNKLHFARLRIRIHAQCIAWLHFAVQKLQRQRVLDQPLNRTLHRPRAVRRIVAFAEEQSFRRRSEVQFHLLLAEPLQQMPQLKVNDVLDLVLAQRTEQHDIINPVQELRTEDLAQGRHGLFACLL